MKYMGLVHIPEDGCVYLNLINQAKDGNHLFFNHFTSEKHIPLYFNLFFLTIGRLAKLFNLSALQAFYLAKAAVLFIFVFFSFYLFRCIFKNNFWAWYALMLLIFGGGFGWLRIFFPNMPHLFASNYMSEGNIFFSLLTYPHFVLSVILMMLSLFLFFLGWDKKSFLYSFLGGFFSLLLGMIHTYNLVVIWMVLFLFSIVALFIQKKNISYVIANIGFVSLFTFPLALFNYYVVKNIYVFSKWYELYFHSPPPLDYLLSLGIVVIPFMVGIFLVFSDKEKLKLFLLFWVIGQSIVLYFPLPFQRKLFEGFQVPVTILAVFGLIQVVKRYFPAKGKTVFLSVFLILAMLNSVWLPIKIMNDIKDNNNYYLTNEDWKAFEWMKKNTKEGDVVLSRGKTAKYIPAVLERVVYVGHWSQTVDLKNKLFKLSRFYLGEYDEEEVEEFLIESGISVIYHGVNEKKLFKITELKYDCLEKMYDEGEVQIYRVL